jgi:hypothetical protein
MIHPSDRNDSAIPIIIPNCSLSEYKLCIPTSQKLESCFVVETPSCIREQRTIKKCVYGLAGKGRAHLEMMAKEAVSTAALPKPFTILNTMQAAKKAVGD